MFTLNKATVLVNGMKNVKQVFSQEFNTVKTGTLSKGSTALFGGTSLLFETDKSRHQFLRRLVGQSMTPEQVNLAIPALVKSATEQINTLQTEEPVEMEQVLQGFTLDVAWRQILGKYVIMHMMRYFLIHSIFIQTYTTFILLGLDLKDDEIKNFYDKVDDWIGGILNPLNMILPGKRLRKSGKALKYLMSKIERKLNDLEKNGPDEGSTLSGMYFAKDEEDPTKTLNRSEIISNSLLVCLIAVLLDD